MANRRQFLQVSMAASAWAFLAQSKAEDKLLESANQNRLGYYKFVFDNNIPNSVQAAHFMNIQAVQTYGMANSDITSFWFNELDTIWRQMPIPVAGMTAAGPLFCLETLASQHGMKVVFRAEHSVNSGRLQHKIQGPEEIVTAAEHKLSALPEQNKHWTEEVSQLMLGCPIGQTALSDTTITLPFGNTLKQQPEFDQVLYSWIIAPIRKQV